MGYERMGERWHGVNSMGKHMLTKCPASVAEKYFVEFILRSIQPWWIGQGGPPLNGDR